MDTTGLHEGLNINRDDFTICSLDDELRVDGLCQALLRRFHHHLLKQGTPPDQASTLASGADYYARDFVVSARQRNIFDERPGAVRRFAGTWYIINTLEPNMVELTGHLRGVADFYRFLERNGLISDDFLRTVELECSDLEYYRQRIETFWKIEGDGYLAWERECTEADA